MTPPEQKPTDEAIRDAAVRWIIRRDRGLSAAESIEYELWLAADERHAAAVRRTTGAWSLLDRLPEALARPVVARARRRRAFWRRAVVLAPLAAAAAVALVWWQAGRREFDADPRVRQASATPRVLDLPDGTLVRLNAGTEIIEQFTPGERRVRLVHGEAHFSVTKNPARPFIVQAGGVSLRAVGTAFNVRLESNAIEVLVTEGVVRVDPRTGPALADAAAAGTDAGFGPAHPAAAASLLNSGQRAKVALDPVLPDRDMVVTAMSEDEISRELSWQEPLLRLGGATLAEVAAGFERRTGRRVILADPALAELRLGGRFRADDVDGFASLLATALDLDVGRTPGGDLVLRKKLQAHHNGN